MNPRQIYALQHPISAADPTISDPQLLHTTHVAKTPWLSIVCITHMPKVDLGLGVARRPTALPNDASIQLSLEPTAFRFEDLWSVGVRCGTAPSFAALSRREQDFARRLALALLKDVGEGDTREAVMGPWLHVRRALSPAESCQLPGAATA